MRIFLRVATVGIPAGFTLACTVGDGDITSIDPIWFVEITPADGACPLPPEFGARAWSELIAEEDIADVDNSDKVAGQKFRWNPDPTTGPDEDGFLDCPLDHDAFMCDPWGEGVEQGRLHVRLAGTRDDDEHITGTADVIGTIGEGSLDPTPTSQAIWCSDTWLLDAVRVIDTRIRTSKVDKSCELEGTVQSAVNATAANLIVANNSSTRVEIGRIDATGTETRVITAEPASVTTVSTTEGSWFRLYAVDDGRCVGMVEVTETETEAVVHGLQD